MPRPALVVALAAIAACGPHPRWSVVESSPADRVEVTHRSPRTLVDVRSSDGFGRATFARGRGEAPREIRFRFHLRGLEELRLDYDSTTVVVHVPTAAPHEPRTAVRVGPRAALRSVDAESVWAVRVRFHPAAGDTAAIPRGAGVIAVDAPRDLVESGARRFTVHWIDFHR